MPSTPRRTPGSQTPAARASARRPAAAGTGARPGAARTGTGRAGTRGEAEQSGRKSTLGRFAEAVRKDGDPKATPRTPTNRNRSTRRPGARRTTASSGADRRFHRRSGGRFTGRAAIVALVVSVLVLTLAYPMQEYLAQRSQLAAAEQEQAEQLQRIADLEIRKQKWNDPAYIRAQAGKRLQLVEPGVTVYYVKKDPEPVAAQPGPGGQPAGRTSSKAPWYSQLWSSVQAADRPAASDPSVKPAGE